MIQNQKGCEAGLCNIPTTVEYNSGDDHSCGRSKGDAQQQGICNISDTYRETVTLGQHWKGQYSKE